MWYILLFFVAATVAVVFYQYGDQFEELVRVPGLSPPCEQGGANSCLGTSVVLRIMCGCAIFFSACLPTALAEEAFTGWWAIKLPVFALSVFCSFSLPRDSINSFGIASQVLAAAFLILLALITTEGAFELQARPSLRR